MIVVDTNVIAYCWIRGERTEVAQRVRFCDPDWHAPILWRSELRSTLAGYVWRNAFDRDTALAAMTAAESALRASEHLVASEQVLELAANSHLSAYDCEFVALAESLAVPLVTEDRAVLKAFPEKALSMERFLESFPMSPPAAHQKRRGYRGSKRARTA